ncbi:MAG: hypothetical protein ACI9DF_004003 [Verrucomicrobiales bacterium]|jgi:hypothetical protein
MYKKPCFKLALFLCACTVLSAAEPSQSPMAGLNALEPGATRLSTEDSRPGQRYRLERSEDLQH